MRPHFSLSALLGIAFLLAAPTARAGLFDDAGAREQINVLKQESAQKFDTLSKAQLELSTQMLGLREEISRLYGEIETLRHENEQLNKRQQDLYLDLDSRLSRFEGSSGSARPAGRTAAPSANQAAENQAYENALNLFRASKFKEATTAFSAFVQGYPDSDMAPNAQFWLGNAWYAQNRCKEAMEAQLALLQEWPDAARAPDATLVIANCQRDMKNRAAEQGTLKEIIARYPASPVATEAKKRLGIK
ncbi:MAG: tol-pal system protein YbgF [Zoogloeaceae bacterium]|jgi:tol-pal system protein YbgF|nr:tol-pal system protein YbgF [Zoogloeaceae bacterium]